jgi:formate hydrogenlyase subunit 3/multisubunit Na+/H+ antiporter MnhD subunit
MPVTATSSTVAALSIAGIPPFACFISEFLIFVGAFETISSDGFYLMPVILMLIATVLSLGYALRFVAQVFLGSKKNENAKDPPPLMELSMLFLTILVVTLGVFPTLFIQLISTVSFA